jgi:hypothetical protein
MDERRKTRRGRVLYGAAVDFNGRQSVFDCVVRNYCQDGAQIELSSGALLPDTVNLTIRHRGETLRAKTVWQRHHRAGLAFSREGSRTTPNDTVIDLAARREAIRRRLGGFLSDETAGVGFDSLLVLTTGGLVAAGIGHVASEAIEQKFDYITDALRHLN